MTDIVINSVSQSATGTHKYVSVSVNGGPEQLWSFGPEDFARVIYEDARDLFIKRLKMEWKERSLGAVTVAKLSTLLTGKTFQI